MMTRYSAPSSDAQRPYTGGCLLHTYLFIITNQNKTQSSKLIPRRQYIFVTNSKFSTGNATELQETAAAVMTLNLVL